MRRSPVTELPRHILDQLACVNRRQFLGSLSMGVGAAALSQWLPPLAQGGSLLIGPPHHAPRAKRVIFLCMAGGPSHLETFDEKPKLVELDGTMMPESFTKGMPIAPTPGQAVELSRISCDVRQLRRERPENQQLPAAHRIGRRRDRDHPFDGDRADQPRPGAYVHEHRLDHLRSTQHGLVGELRTRFHQREPSRLRGPHQRRGGATRNRSHRGSGPVATCQVDTRASNSMRRVIPSITSPARQG